MSVSRRKAIGLSGATLAGFAVAPLLDNGVQAQPLQAVADAWPDSLVERPMRAGFPAPLPLNADGSAPEHPASEAGPITDPLMWKTRDKEPPPIEFDYRKMAVKVDTRGLARLGGTLRFSDLEKLPQVTGTYLLQCGSVNPRGVVSWTGVRFRDVADMLGVLPSVHYCRFVASDKHYVDEPMSVLRHPQVMLVWMMNGQPLAPKHGAPLRLVMPFRYGNRSIKAITEMVFGTPALPAPPMPG